ncbi:MAG: hypothetical protein MJ229_01405 [bacterium]|nr:hypothetical protein [bacterium]
MKNFSDKSVDELLEKFIDDEKYYLEINSSRFQFIENMIDDDSFRKDVKLFLEVCKKYYDYQKAQEPLKLAQKEYDKQKRKFLQEVKMSKENPTKRQLSYYNSLCKRYNLDKKDVENFSKLEMRDLIQEILDEQKDN